MNAKNWLFVLVAIVISFFYHSHGNNDWFSMSVTNPNLDPDQIANEIISAIFMGVAMIIVALSSSANGKVK